MTTTSTNDQMPTTFPAKWAKILKDIPEFKEVCEQSSSDELKAIIITSEGNVANIEAAKADDDKLNAARELIKELGAPYRDAIKCQRCKIAYALFCLESQGVEIGDKDTE
jgi:hypothetical protein